ncbi:hypothetical protein M0722_16280 [Microbacterium sp. KSW4-16]|uniref:hypothetical protein n=1 Tax=Microbacterium aurugineum TaxID=2851642 RepID=UPI0020BF24BA|nr:hypothetical protein [Microbacterium aurugineum]MCK8468753.1 hypothetical protein [Microbacterium aurugineum]
MLSAYGLPAFVHSGRRALSPIAIHSHRGKNMYGAIPGGGAAGGGVLVLTGGSVVSTVFGIAIIAVALGVLLFLVVRERRRLRYLAELEATPRPMYRRHDVIGPGA